MPKPRYLMTLEGLVTSTIETEINSLSFGELSDDDGSVRSRFTIQRTVDKWSPLMQQANSAGQTMQVTIRKDVLGDWGHLLKRTIYSFYDALIQSIQSSGSASEGITEVVHFDSKGFDFKSDSNRGASYRGRHKGKGK